MANNETRSNVNYHAITIDEVLAGFSSAFDGLSSQQVHARIASSGPNQLQAARGEGPLKKLFKQVCNPLVGLLGVAAIVSLVLGHFIDAGVITGVVVLNTAMGFIQEWRAERALEALSRLSAPIARVLRDGDEQDIPSAQVVLGDILILEAGARVSADARVLDCDQLAVDESALTGESEPVAKRTDDCPVDAPLAERTNMVWMSTPVTAGRGRAVVVAVGMDTQIGSIAGQVRRTKRADTPLQKRLRHLGVILGVGGLVVAGVMFFLGLWQGHSVEKMLLFSVAVAVSAIPEGLPAVISVTLALGVQKMAAKRAIIRRLTAVETLGSTTVICTDKTGTITENQMTVTKIWAGGGTYKFTGIGYDPTGELLPVDEESANGEEPTAAAQMLMQIGILANNCELESDDDVWRIEGDPTEGAVLVASAKAGLDSQALINHYPRLDEIPFSSDYKYMATLHGGGQTMICLKGAPECVVDFCSHILIDGEPIEMTDEYRRQIHRANNELADEALRVMAGAFRNDSSAIEQIENSDVESGLTFAGLWGMVDPARPEAVVAIEDAQNAGIRVVMITGDQPATAGAIARNVGIARTAGKTITGADLQQMSQEELTAQVNDISVFARVTPAHKLSIIKALQDNGQIVAMTGDGVNDAPALKSADIGVAMGLTGTEVAKEAAEMVLTDDNFETIVHAVEAGRVIFSNLRSVAFFLLTTSLAEIVTLGVGLLLGLPLPLTAIMILWINLISDGAADIPLGIEPMHLDVLKHKPRSPQAGLLDWSMFRRMLFLAPVVAAGTLGLFAWNLKTGTLPHARTVAFTTLAAFQWFQAINSRSEHLSVFRIGLFSNRWLIGGIALAVVLQLGVIYTWPGQKLFGTVGLTLADWAMIVPVAASVWFVDEIFKLLGLNGSSKK